MSEKKITYRKTFKTLTEMVEFADGAVARGQSSHRGSKEFTGTSSWVEAVDIAFCWKDGLTRIADFNVRINKNTRSSRKIVTRREVGPGVVSMGHLVQGHPRVWVKQENTNIASKSGRGNIVRIIVNGSANCDVPTEAMEARGAAVASLVQGLERAGKRCEIRVVYPLGTWGSDNVCLTEIVVKKPETTLNMQKLVFSLAHASMFRRIVFGCLEEYPREVVSEFGLHGGKGHAVELPDSDIPQGSIYLGTISAYGQDWTDPVKSAEWVAVAALEHGVTLG